LSPFGNGRKTVLLVRFFATKRVPGANPAKGGMVVGFYMEVLDGEKGKI
jgi:hypothetical protein